ncbi:MAG: GNAT family N-acetyltransferase [Defluviitaleaceae bacterium]|nr:GNAT family N-acetyltransferase [Defluviitaleaceae bacterium]
MIFPLEFKAHLQAHQIIATAFEIFKDEMKINVEQWQETASNPEAWYKAFISNYMHGAFRCTKTTEIITVEGRLRLRTANIDDYDFINKAEQDEDCTPWVNNWPLHARIEKFGDNNFYQTIIETFEGNPVGFIDFRDMLSDTQVELKRIVIAERGKGYGKEAMYLSQRFAFEVLNRNRLYLGTKVNNARAIHLYHATGFNLVDPNNTARFHLFKKDWADVNKSGKA